MAAFFILLKSLRLIHRNCKLDAHKPRQGGSSTGSKELTLIRTKDLNKPYVVKDVVHET